MRRADEPDLREREPEGLREQRQQHVSDVRESIVQRVRGAAGGERAFRVTPGQEQVRCCRGFAAIIAAAATKLWGGTQVECGMAPAAGFLIMPK